MTFMGVCMYRCICKRMQLNICMYVRMYLHRSYRGVGVCLSGLLTAFCCGVVVVLSEASSCSGQ